jgi:membrane associated rhomboid family serine protease
MFIGASTIGNGVFYNWFSLHFPKNDLFQPWQFVTHMFMHGDIMHIAFNMLALWMFGTAVEQVFGAKKFIIFYFLSGLGAAFIMISWNYFQYNSGISEIVNSTIYTSTEVENAIRNGQYLGRISDIFDTPMVGASGAIMGLLVAFGMLYPESKLMLIFLPIPIKAKYFIPGIIALDLFSAITGQSIFSPNNTAYVAHIGGALTGFILMWIWKKNQFDKYRWN